jgi:hypothetical protein
MLQVRIACPACTEVGETEEAVWLIDHIFPEPRRAQFVCKSCGTRWRLNFYEVTDDSIVE